MIGAFGLRLVEGTEPLKRLHREVGRITCVF